MTMRSWSIALVAAVAAYLLATALMRRRVPVATRVGPYVQHARTRLGTAPLDIRTDAPRSLVATLASGLASLVDVNVDRPLSTRLVQAGADMDADAYRNRQLAGAVAGTVTGLVIGLLVGGGTPLALLMAALLGFFGATRSRTWLDRLTQQRRERMRTELYTICQLLGIYLRSGDTPHVALGRLVDRANGAVVTDLANASRLMHAGSEPQRVLDDLATATPEPAAARLYRLLSATWSSGGDPGALFALADDLRTQRRDEIGRRMAKRQTAMVLPLVVIIGPIMILFVAAAIPSLVFGR